MSENKTYKIFDKKEGLNFIAMFIMLITALLLNQVAMAESAVDTLLIPSDVPDNILDNTQAEGNFRIFLRDIINYFLYFLGLVSVIAVIFAGFLYVTSAGEQEKADKAKKIITYAAAGIIIILMSFAIVNTVIKSGLGEEMPDRNNK